MRKLFMIAAAAVSLWVGTAHAAVPIAGLINTGVNTIDLGPTNGKGDNIWSLYDSNAYVNGVNFNDPPGLYWAYANYTGTLAQYGPAWLANNATSEWISFCTVGNGGANCLGGLDDVGDGTYVYGMDFDLTGFQPGTASFNARFLVDNSVASITLNGNTITPSLLGAVPYTDWSSFSANSGFVDGINQLRITVTNSAYLGTIPGAIGSNPTGLRVEFLDSAVSAIPEPGEWAMMLSGLGVVALIAARRRREVAAT